MNFLYLKRRFLLMRRSLLKRCPLLKRCSPPCCPLSRCLLSHSRLSWPLGWTGLLLLAPLFFAVACFDYEERLLLRRNFSGLLQVSYSAPIYYSERRPLLGFLPITHEAIEERYHDLVASGQITLTNIRIGSIQKSEESEESEKKSFFRLLPVSYQIHFRDPQVLERILLGEKIALRRLRKKLRISRHLPAATATEEQAMPPLLQSLQALFLSYLEDRSLYFSLRFPPEWRLVSNQGRLVEAGYYEYRFGFKRTLLAKEDLDWQVTVSAEE